MIISVVPIANIGNRMLSYMVRLAPKRKGQGSALDLLRACGPSGSRAEPRLFP